MTIDLHDAIAQAAEGARQLGAIAQSARRRVVELEVELEDARQELGRLRAAAEGTDPVIYLLWSGKRQAWWAPDARGYTPTEREAGRFTRAQAVRYVVTSAQCGVRDQVTTMVAAPDNWVAQSRPPVVLAVDPGVQVEQEARRG